MEALKRAEREKHKVAPDEPEPEENSTGLIAEPDWPPTPEPLQDKDSFPALKWTEPMPGAPLAGYPHPNLLPEGEGAIVKGADFELLPPEPAPTTSIPPIAAAEPAFGPSAEATRAQSAMPPPQATTRREEPESAKSTPLRVEPTLGNDPPSAIKPPPAPEATTAQRRQHAANVLAATKKPARNRLLRAAASATAIFLLAGGAYLYWQYPQLLQAPGQGGRHPTPIARPPVAAEMATVAPSQPPAPHSSSPILAAETAARKMSLAGKPQTPPPPTAPLAEQAPK